MADSFGRRPHHRRLASGPTAARRQNQFKIDTFLTFGRRIAWQILGIHVYREEGRCFFLPIRFSLVVMTTRLPQNIDSLLASAKAGDDDALSKLFATYHNYIRLLADAQLRSRLRIRVSGSDVAQDVFLNAHRGFANFRGTTGGEFVVWLRTILTNRIGYLVQQHFDAQIRDVRREVSLETIGGWVDRSSGRLENALRARDPSPRTQLQNHERSIQLADALARLSKDHREVLLLRSLEGLGFKEVAERMGRSHGAVRMLWLRGIEALRDELSEKQGGEPSPHEDDA